MQIDMIDIISQLFLEEYLTPEETMSPSMVLNINWATTNQNKI